MALLPFGAKDIQTALALLGHAGEEALKWRVAVGDINNVVMGKCQGYDERCAEL